MLKTIAAVAALLSLAACNTARTAYSVDRTKSWACVPNTQVQYPPLPSGAPMVMLETPAEQKLAQEIQRQEQAKRAAQAKVASAPK